MPKLTLQAVQCIEDVLQPPEDTFRDINISSGHKVNASTQTDLNILDLELITESMQNLRISCDESDKAFRNLQKQMNNLMLKEETFINNNTKTKFFTGIASSNTLFQIHEQVHDYLVNHTRSSRTNLTTFQILILSLMKLRLNLSYSYLSYRLIKFQIKDYL